MYRCFVSCLVPMVAAVTLAAPAAAQMPRAFPQNALRGTIEFGSPPQIALNGRATQLAPGARIRGLNNLLVMSGAAMGTKAIVNYTFDASGMVRDVWLLRPEEIRVRPWPTSVEQTQTWQFDPAAQTWTKP